jgi:lysophospholipase L1-like esterase
MKTVLVCLLFAVAALAQSPERAWEPKPRAREYPWMSLSAWNARHDAMLRRALAGRVDVLFLGDSITEGWGDNAVWQRFYAPRNAANFGIGGDTTQNVLWRIENGALVGLAPQVVVLMIGTNNLGLHNDSPEDVAKGVAAILRTLHHRQPQARVLLLGLFPRDAQPDTKHRRSITDINARLAQLADGRAVRFLDLGGKFLSPDGTLAREIMPDFLHLSEKGYALWAEGMEPVLAEMLAR